MSTKKTKYNPSGQPVLSKSKHNKGMFIKQIENHRKRLDKFKLKPGSGKNS